MRKCFFWLHLIAGVVAGSIVLVMSVTGVLLMYERQMVSFAERGYLASAEPGTARLPVNEIVERVSKAEPDAAPGSVTLRADPAAPLAVGFGREKTVYVNPYTGAILGEGSKLRDFFHEVTAWHRWLGSRDGIGKQVTGACNAAFIFLIVTGMVLWCPRSWPWTWNWRKLKPGALFNFRLRGKARDFNWHNVIGIWSAPVLLLITVTALVMSYPWASNLIYTLTGSEPPPQRAGGPGGRGGREGRGGGEKGERARPAMTIDLDPLFAAAQKQTPNWMSITINLPQAGGPGGSRGKGITASISEALKWHPFARSSLTLDPKTAAVIKWEPFMEQPLGRVVRGMVRPVHTGEAGGLIGQTIAGLASAGGAVLVWTGLALTWRRFLGRKRRTSPSAEGLGANPAPVANLGSEEA